MNSLSVCYRSRGLSQLLSSRNIRTLGDLASLTEADIQSLPIRAPKVETVKKALEKRRLKMSEDKSKLKPFGAGAATENGCVVNGRLFSVLIMSP